MHAQLLAYFFVMYAFALFPLPFSYSPVLITKTFAIISMQVGKYKLSIYQTEPEVREGKKTDHELLLKNLRMHNASVNSSNFHPLPRQPRELAFVLGKANTSTLPNVI